MSLDLPPQPSFSASPYTHDAKAHLLLAASGSVATIKLPNILHALSSHPSLSIRLLLTSSATQFLAGQSAEQPTLASLLTIRNVDGVHLDAHEWETPWVRGASILHIELRRWAHLLAVVPLSANSLAKIVGGWSGDLLGSVVRAWDTMGIDAFTLPAALESSSSSSSVENTEEEAQQRSSKVLTKKKILVAPAMNTAMWRHPITARQIRVLEVEWGGEEGWFEVLRPQEKELACGDVGDGAMKDWKEVVGVIEERLGLVSESAEAR